MLRVATQSSDLNTSPPTSKPVSYELTTFNGHPAVAFGQSVLYLKNHGTRPYLITHTFCLGTNLPKSGWWFQAVCYAARAEHVQAEILPAIRLLYQHIKKSGKSYPSCRHMITY